MTPTLWLLVFVVLGFGWMRLVPPVLGWKRTVMATSKATFSVTLYAGTAVVHTNIQSAFGEFNAATNRRHPVDLTGYRQCRVTYGGGVNGNAGSLGAVRMSIDGGTVFTLIGSAPLDNIVTNIVGGSWTDIPANLLTEGILQFGTQGGDGAADPSISTCRVDFRR